MHLMSDTRSWLNLGQEKVSIDISLISYKFALQDSALAKTSELSWIIVTVAGRVSKTLFLGSDRLGYQKAVKYCLVNFTFT